MALMLGYGLIFVFHAFISGHAIWELTKLSKEAEVRREAKKRAIEGEGISVWIRQDG